MTRTTTGKRAAILIEYIMNSLRDGKLRSGDQLPSEHELMRLSGISRGSAREALSALELVGVIRRQQGGGTFIKSTAPIMFGINSEELFLEFLKDAENNNYSFSAYEARILFEPKVAALAASRAEKTDIDALSAIMEKMNAAAEGGNSEQMVKCDLDFHIAVADATQNELIAKTIKRFVEMASAQMFRAYQRSNPKVVCGEHLSIFEAIRDGDQEAARICCEYNLLKNHKPR